MLGYYHHSEQSMQKLKHKQLGAEKLKFHPQSENDLKSMFVL